MKKMLQKSMSLILTVAMALSITIVNVVPTHAEAQVYVTPTGSRYHSYKCGRGNYYLVSLSTAKARGLTPCQKCWSGPVSGSSNDSSSSSNSNKKTNTVAKMKLSSTSIVLLKGQCKKLTAKSASGKVSWTSSEKKIATVSGGKVTAKGKGTATITAKTKNQTAHCKVKVEEPVLSSKQMSIAINQEYKQLKVKGCSHEVTWSSANDEIASVDEYGYIEPESIGKTTITAKVHGKKFKCTVNVTVEPDETYDYDYMDE